MVAEDNCVGRADDGFDKRIHAEAVGWGDGARTLVRVDHKGADKAGEVRRAAERTAAQGAALAKDAGFTSCSLAVEASPTWQGIVQTAERYGASVIVLGPHRRSKLLGQLQGSVVEAVLAHTDIPVLAIPEPNRNGTNVFRNDREFALS